MKDHHASARASGWVGFALITGGLSGCAGVALDALSAHAFKQRLGAHDITTLATTARYLLVHGLLLMLVAGWLRSAPGARLLKAVVILAATGIVLFCGGLTAKVLSGVSILGIVAPLGGSALMAAWLGCAIYAVTSYRQSH